MWGDGTDITLPCSTPWFNRTGSSKREAAIIGGGIASALLSLALLRRGWQVTLYCADEAPALGASGNRQGALYPLLSKHDEALNRFSLMRLLLLVGFTIYCPLNLIMTGAASRS